MVNYGTNDYEQRLVLLLQIIFVVVIIAIKIILQDNLYAHKATQFVQYNHRRCYKPSLIITKKRIYNVKQLHDNKVITNIVTF